MQTSARNRFPGKVRSVHTGLVTDEITLDIAGGQCIVAAISHASTLKLGIKPGMDAFALVKASALMVVTGDGSAGQFSASNRLQGSVAQLTQDAVHAEIVIALDGGMSATALITSDSNHTLGLAVGDLAGVIFKASSVVIGVEV
ncbi:MAG: TOBE domain-containing protein [Burkholderiaceae bacterium]|nr:TOBE domain-containing protein [Burkholderiaceae bacterium]